MSIQKNIQSYNRINATPCVYVLAIYPNVGRNKKNTIKNLSLKLHLNLKASLHFPFMHAFSALRCVFLVITQRADTHFKIDSNIIIYLLLTRLSPKIVYYISRMSQLSWFYAFYLWCLEMPSWVCTWHCYLDSKCLLYLNTFFY